MWAMGTDFRYQYAVSWFRQMDKFIHYVNMVHTCSSKFQWFKIFLSLLYSSFGNYINNVLIFNRMAVLMLCIQPRQFTLTQSMQQKRHGLSKRVISFREYNVCTCYE